MTHLEEAESLRPFLRNFAKRRFPGLDPDDLVQDALIRLLGAKKLTPGKSVKNYLQRTVERLAYDAMRARRRRIRPLCSVDDPEQLVEPSALPKEFAEVDAALSVREFFLMLNERERMIVLWMVQGYTYDDIAGKLGVATSTVRTLIHRIRRGRKDRTKKGVALSPKAA